MLVEFIRLVHQLFPSIDPYTAASCLAAIKQHGDIDPSLLFAFGASQEPTDLYQGDLVGPLVFTRVGRDGSVKRYSTAGLMLSNSCDAENDLNSVFAATIPVERFDGDRRASSIRANIIFNLFYLPDVPELGGQVVDMSLVQSISTHWLRAGLIDGSLRRYAGFSQLGYYFFLSKLTVHLLRPETEEVIRGPERVSPSSGPPATRG